MTCQSIWRLFKRSAAMRASTSNDLQFVAAAFEDRDTLADIRVKAMRPSLEAIGRFDEERARNRFLTNFAPEDTWKLIRAGRTVGFFVLRAFPDHLYLDHLYVLPDQQGRGIGEMAVQHVKAEATRRKLPIRLIALKESPANGFYQKHGFQLTGADELDNRYEWGPA
jgi:ribosomal protein S18 acetylase RimI-like enzyme